jgi:hypothetical protein
VSRSSFAVVAMLLSGRGSGVPFCLGTSNSQPIKPPVNRAEGGHQSFCPRARNRSPAVFPHDWVRTLVDIFIHPREARSSRPHGTPANMRRSVYRDAKRNLKAPLFEAFDQPDRLTSCPVRALSTFAPRRRSGARSARVRRIHRPSRRSRARRLLLGPVQLQRVSLRGLTRILCPLNASIDRMRTGVQRFPCRAFRQGLGLPSRRAHFYFSRASSPR